jgi:hypothetical protein
MKWEETDPHTVIAPAFSCTINQGIINENGNCLDLPVMLSYVLLVWCKPIDDLSLAIPDP